MRTHTRHHAPLGLAALLVASACASQGGTAEATGTSSDALSAAQCSAFAVNGRTRICHATGSAKNPYVLITVAEAGCIDGHAGHANDFVSVDGTCAGHALPPGSPCDGTLACSDGYACRDGTCQVNCLDADGDGYGAYCAAGSDCDDERRDVNPGASEVCGNGLDDDCSGATTDRCVSDPCASGHCGTGCADGEREGFLDVTRYPAIAACSGGWSVPGVFQDYEPACGRGGGDDSTNPNGTGCSASDLCAPGWHVCRTSTEVGTRAGAGGCTGTIPAGTFYATGQSGNGCGFCSVSSDPADVCSGNTCLSSCYPSSVQTNDVFGCGTIGAGPASNCAPLNSFSHNACSMLPAPWNCADSNGWNEALRVVKNGSAAGGVLCCVD